MHQCPEVPTVVLNDILPLPEDFAASISCRELLLLSSTVFIHNAHYGTLAEAGRSVGKGGIKLALSA